MTLHIYMHLFRGPERNLRVLHHWNQFRQSRLAATAARLAPPGVAIGVFAAASAITVLLVNHEVNRTRAIDEARFAAHVDDASDAITTSLNNFELLLGGARGFVHGSETVSRQEWRTYAQDLNIDETAAGIKGLALVRGVTHEALPDLIEEMQREYLPDFRVHSAPDADLDDAEQHQIIVYHEPLERNMRAIGFDISLNPEAIAAQELARDTGLISMTGPTPLVQDMRDTDRIGLVMYAATYDKSLPLLTVEQRRVAHTGFIGAPVFADALIGRAIGQNVSSHIGMAVRDRDSDVKLWGSGGVSDADSVAERVVQIKRGGRTWDITFVAHPSFSATASAPAKTAGAGTIATVLLTALVWSLKTLHRRGRTEVARMTARAGELEARFTAAFESSGIGMALIDTEGRWLRVNNALVRLLGPAASSVDKGNLHEVVHRDYLTKTLAAVRGINHNETRHVNFECRFKKDDGDDIWCDLSLSGVADGTDANGKAAYIVVQIQDATTRKASEHALEHAATHDVLTGLASRSQFKASLSGCFDQGDRNKRRSGFAVLFLDLDRFKEVNDTLGHEAGDGVLVGVARRICGSLRGSGTTSRPGGDDLPARLGGDEFVVLLRDVSSRETAIAVARRLRDALAKDFHINGQPITVGASIGVATSFGGYANADEMLRRADHAMYDAKGAGRLGRGDVVVADDVKTFAASEPLRLAA